jgi:hypothetical protein
MAGWGELWAQLGRIRKKDCQNYFINISCFQVELNLRRRERRLLRRPRIYYYLCLVFFIAGNDPASRYEAQKVEPHPGPRGGQSGQNF